MKTRILQILGVAAVATMGMVSCTTDACKDVDCGAWGTCLDGVCVCDDGYEGTDCDTEERAKFVGTYVASGTITCPVTGNGTFSAETVTVANSATSVTKITIDFAGVLLTATVNGTGVTVDQATIDGLTYTGSGSINGNTLSLTLNEEEPNVETCIYQITAIKQ